MELAPLMGMTMLPQVLTSLYEIRARLQSSLSRRPEYRALELLERSTLQLADALAPRGEQILVSKHTSPRQASTAGIHQNERLFSLVQEAQVEERVALSLLEAPTAGAVAAGEMAPPVTFRDSLADPGDGPVVETGASPPKSARAGFLPFVGAPHVIGVGRY
jgi:hypothetical protein